MGDTCDRHPNLRCGMRRPATGDGSACLDDPEPAAGLSRLHETEASRIYPSARSGLRRYRSEAAAGLRCVRCAGEDLRERMTLDERGASLPNHHCGYVLR